MPRQRNKLIRSDPELNRIIAEVIGKRVLAGKDGRITTAKATAIIAKAVDKKKLEEMIYRDGYRF